MIDLSAVSAGLLAARFDPPRFTAIDRPAWTSRNLLNCHGLTVRRARVRLGTVLIGPGGTLRPLWSDAGARVLAGRAEAVLLGTIAERLRLPRPVRVRR
ncbi:hypothetical protein [Glycomyces sp. MUSA5-2]|uniref:hypothetical protein n=1 Tax=Glycomyces sp. MUSA5-2 TaxID=2053002 RepID=UPI00300A9E18